MTKEKIIIVNETTPEFGEQQIGDSLIKRVWGDIPFNYDVRELSGEQQDVRVVWEDDQLVVDQEQLDRKYGEVIEHFLRVYDKGGIREDVQFGWYVAEETDEDLAELVEYFRGLQEKFSTLHSQNLKQKIAEASVAMKDMAVRRLIRESLGAQMGLLPIRDVEILDLATNTKVTVPFNEKLLDAGDFIFTNSSTGAELVISMPKGKQLSKFTIDKEEPVGKFAFVNGERFYGPEQEFQHWEMEFAQGGSKVRPAFKKLILLRDYMDFDKALDELLEERERTRQQQKAAASRPSTTYQSNPPSTPSSSGTRWSQQTTYVRSG